ncbi:hemolysin III family protein [Gordonia jinghuaiqii]|uniref:Hemolysin III family protein n=1 Tax=Gordonia jinghuaiqii TaxID=2758710 RepID=A0A7D7LYS4_9ACTN|nr:hemolysin III family protein [Gordonia jinghuaiqii]MCR5978727.1 hemolysin III family protein [Gordonia jinghuaiqii]QMT03038.1 hemolysin III family protein [Gordonia jinghuaiqii]
MSTLLNPSADDRPRLRGVIHHYSAYAAAVAGLALVVGAALTQGALATVTCAIYAVTVVGLFSVSAVYHRVPWKTSRARIRMKRADHSMIFVFIAGTYTPFCALGLPSPTSWWVLGVVWVGALSGATLKILWPAAPRWLGVTLYILLGWVIVAVAPALATQTGVAVMILLALGGVFYSVGGVLYALRRPDPWPATFGYHEVFHVCTAIAALLHYAAAWMLISG